MKRITRVLMAFALMPLMALAVESSAELSTWTSDFVAAKAVADSENRPMVVVWSNYGCAYCERLYVALTNTEVMTWLSNTNYVSVYSIGDKDVKDFARNDSGLYPYVAVYWNKSDGVTNKVTFTGRSGKMPKLKGTLAGQFMASVDKTVGTMRGDYVDTDERVLSFDANGGTCSIDSMIVETGVSVRYYHFPLPVRKGYRFLGWFTAAVGGDEVGSDATIADSATFYAHWDFISDYIWEYDYYDDNGECAVVSDCLLPLSANGKLVFPRNFNECITYILSGEAFGDRDDITSVEFSAGLRNSEDTPIGFSFWGCTNLLSFAVGDDNPDFVSNDGALYSRDKKHLVIVPRGITEFVIPDGVEVVDDGAFSGCLNLASVTIPASVTNIADGAFANCPTLKSMVFEGAAPTCSSSLFDELSSNLIIHADASHEGWGYWNGKSIVFDVVSSGSIQPTVVMCSNLVLTVTNVVLHYVLNSVVPEIAVPVSGSTGFVNVITEVNGGSGVAIPSEWQTNYPDFAEKFGSDFGEALMKTTGKRDGMGNPMLVWQDFVAGTDPTDEKDVFTASITIVDGLPVISYSPELKEEQAALRVYRTFGKAKLTDTTWTDITEKTSAERADYNFFKVTVEMK